MDSDNAVETTTVQMEVKETEAMQEEQDNRSQNSSTNDISSSPIAEDKKEEVVQKEVPKTASLPSKPTSIMITETAKLQTVISKPKTSLEKGNEDTNTASKTKSQVKSI